MGRQDMPTQGDERSDPRNLQTATRQQFIMCVPGQELLERGSQPRQGQVKVTGGQGAWSGDRIHFGEKPLGSSDQNLLEGGKGQRQRSSELVASYAPWLFMFEDEEQHVPHTPVKGRREAPAPWSCRGRVRFGGWSKSSS